MKSNTKTDRQKTNVPAIVNLEKGNVRVGFNIWRIGFAYLQAVMAITQLSLEVHCCALVGDL